jgi:hypothetical protein
LGNKTLAIQRVASHFKLLKLYYKLVFKFGDLQFPFKQPKLQPTKQIWWTYFEMVLEFERFFALRTLELPQHSTFVMAYHVALQAVHIRKCLVTHFAGLLTKTNTDI